MHTGTACVGRDIDAVERRPGFGALSAFGAKQSNLIAFANDWVAPRD